MSPTPWTVVEVATNCLDILDANGVVVACVMADGDDLSDTDRENAEAIVRYVNTCSE